MKSTKKKNSVQLWAMSGQPANWKDSLTLTTACTDTVCAGHPANSPLPGPTLRRSPLYAHSLSLKPKVPFTDNLRGAGIAQWLERRTRD